MALWAATGCALGAQRAPKARTWQLHLAGPPAVAGQLMKPQPPSANQGTTKTSLYEQIGHSYSPELNVRMPGRAKCCDDVNILAT